MNNAMIRRVMFWWMVIAYFLSMALIADSIVTANIDALFTAMVYFTASVGVLLVVKVWPWDSERNE